MMLRPPRPTHSALSFRFTILIFLVGPVFLLIGSYSRTGPFQVVDRPLGHSRSLGIMDYATKGSVGRDVNLGNCYELEISYHKQK
jgi:hypothetical protein